MLTSFQHPVCLPDRYSPVELLSRLSAPIVRRFRPITPWDIHRANSLLQTPIITQLSDLHPREAHSSIANRCNQARIVLRAAAEIDDGSMTMALPVYELLSVQRPNSEKPNTMVIMRWAIEPSSSLNPKVHVLQPEWWTDGQGRLVSVHLSALEYASKAGSVDVNNPRDFFKQIPISRPTRDRVMFGGVRY